MSRPPAARSCMPGAAPFDGTQATWFGWQPHALEPADERQVPDAALAGAGRLHLARRARLDGVGQVLEVLVGRIAPDLDAWWVLVDERERRVALRRELGQALPVHHADLDRQHAERVAVRRGRRDRGMAHDAAAAGAVHDVHGLAELPLEQGGHDADRRIGAAAGAPGADHRDRTGRDRRPGPEARPMPAITPANAATVRADEASACDSVLHPIPPRIGGRRCRFARRMLCIAQPGVNALAVSIPGQHERRTFGAQRLRVDVISLL